mgnify:CR=1
MRHRFLTTKVWPFKKIHAMLHVLLHKHYILLASSLSFAQEWLVRYIQLTYY